MKTIFIAIIVVCGAVIMNCARAQTYIPIPEANAKWNIHEQFFMPCGSMDFQWGNKDQTITIDGDTIINSITYKKLVSAGHFYTTEILLPPFCNDHIIYYFSNEYYGA